MPETPLLDRVHTPQDLKIFSIKEIKQVCGELRLETIDAVSVTGGHLGAGLGVVELTVALHYVLIRRMTASFGMSAIRPTHIRF